MGCCVVIELLERVGTDVLNLIDEDTDPKLILFCEEVRGIGWDYFHIQELGYEDSPEVGIGCVMDYSVEYPDRPWCPRPPLSYTVSIYSRTNRLLCKKNIYHIDGSKHCVISPKKVPDEVRQKWLKVGRIYREICKYGVEEYLVRKEPWR